MTSLKFYGKNTCISCKKAKAFLDARGIAYEDIAIEKAPPARALLEQVVDSDDIKASLNARSTIYKEKNFGQQTPDKKTVIDLMLQDPNLIKRPLLVNDRGRFCQGFDEQALTGFLEASSG